MYVSRLRGFAKICPWKTQRGLRNAMKSNYCAVKMTGAVPQPLSGSSVQRALSVVAVSGVASGRRPVCEVSASTRRTSGLLGVDRAKCVISRASQSF